MSDAGSFTAASPPIPPQNGPSNNSAKPFLGTPRPRYLLRDSDRIFGDAFSKQVQDMVIQELLAPRSLWQRAYVERGDRNDPA